MHGAFADSSGWNAVAARLFKDGYPVIAFSNPLRGPLSDGEYLRQFLTTIDGPVVLVGHSYGGAVITNAATGNPNVKALVYVAAYALGRGRERRRGQRARRRPHRGHRPSRRAALPGRSAGTATPTSTRRTSVACSRRTSPHARPRFMAATQRPGALAALVTPSGPPAWKTIPSWYLVARQDRIIPPEAERAMAARADATTVEINSSHVAMMSHPAAVTKLILRAAR